MKQMTIFTGRERLDIKLPIIQKIEELHVDNYLWGKKCHAAVACYYPSANILRVELHANEPHEVLKINGVITYFLNN